MIIAGELRQKIIVKELTTSRDPINGSIIETWTPKYTYRAKVNNRAGSKGVINDEIFNTQTVVFTTYYRHIVDTDRIEYKGNDYKIMMIGEFGNNEGLDIITERINE